MPYKVNPTTGQLDYYEVSEGGGGGGETNLSFIPSPTVGTITSDTGTDADIPLADSTNSGLFSPSEQTKLAGIQAGAEVNVNADWNATSGDSQILNKPTIPAAQVNSDWNATSGVAEILNKPESLPSSYVEHSVKYGEDLVKGQAAYVSSSDGTNMIVSKADYTSDSTSSRTIGLIDGSGPLNFQGKILTEGLLTGTGPAPLNTSGSNAGDPVWLGADGNLLFGLANKPAAPFHLVFIGVVTRVNSVNGEIFVKVQNGFEIDEIHDITVVGRANNTLLGYNSSTSLHEFKTVANWIGYTPANKAGETFTGNISASNLSGTNTGDETTATIKTKLGPSTPSDDGYLTSTDWSAFDGKQDAITLTTTGTSGAATLVGDTLNIPNYASGSGEPSGSILSTTRSLPFKMATNVTTYRSASAVGSATVSSTTFAGESTHYFPISLKEGSPVNAAAFRVNSAGSGGLGTAEIEIGIYNATTNANGELIPGTLEVQFGKVSVLSTGVKEAVLASPYTLGATVDNIYFIAFRSYSTNSTSLNIYSSTDVLSSWIGMSSSTSLVKLGMFVATTPYTAPTGLPASLPATGGVGFTQSTTVAGYVSNQLLIGIR